MNRNGNLFLSFSVCLFPLLLLITGCGAVHSDSFAEFATSLREIRSGADEALRYNDRASRDHLIQEIAEASQRADGFDAVQNLLIVNDDESPFGREPRNVMQSTGFRSGIHTLNSTLVSYSELLVALTGLDGVSQTEFDDTAKDLNRDIKTALAALQLENPEEVGGIISAGASQAAYDYITHKRNKKLQKILGENQLLIVELSNRLQDAIQIVTENLRSHYDEESIDLIRELRPDLTVGLEARKQNVAKLLELNDELRYKLRILETLSDSYRLLPKAHAELILASGTPSHRLTAIRELYENGEQLHVFYEELRNSEKDRHF